VRTRGKGARHQLGPTLFSAAPSLPCFASYARSHSSHRLPARLKLLFKWALYCALYAVCLLELPVALGSGHCCAAMAIPRRLGLCAGGCCSHFLTTYSLFLYCIVAG